MRFSNKVVALFVSAVFLTVVFAGCVKRDAAAPDAADGVGDILFSVNESRNPVVLSCTRAFPDSLLLAGTEAEDRLLLLCEADAIPTDTGYPQSRGTVATGANVAELFSNADYSGIGISALYQGSEYLCENEYMMLKESTSKWETCRKSYFWPLSTDAAMDFWAWAPAVLPEGQGIISNRQSSASQKTMSFDYTMAAPDNTTKKDPSNQIDLLFAGRPDWKYDSDPEIKGNVPFEFHHALSAVRIIIGRCSAGTLSQISITDVNSQGHCVFTPQPAADSPYFVWSGQTSPETYNFKVDLNLENNPTGTTVLPVTEDSEDARGTIFMFIPQPASGTRMMRLKFKRDGEASEYTYEAPLSDDWLPGMRYTYKLSVLGGPSIEVESTAEGGVESNVGIKNVGNVQVYVRASIAANWCDVNQNITGGCDIGDITSNNEFTKAGNWAEFWIYNPEEDIYYYRKPLVPGETTECNLFDTFTVTYDPLYKTDKVRFSVVAQAVKRDQAGDSDYTTSYKTRSSAQKAWGSDYTNLNE